MNCIDFDVKRSKMLSYSQNIQNNAKLQKWSYLYDELHAIWRQNEQKCRCYVAKHSKQR